MTWRWTRIHVEERGEVVSWVEFVVFLPFFLGFYFYPSSPTVEIELTFSLISFLFRVCHKWVVKGTKVVHLPSVVIERVHLVG